MTKRRNLRRRNLRHSSRRLHHETLEKRELLAAEFGIDSGPRLISLAANSGEQFDLDGNNQLSVSPQELTFRFDGGQELDPSTLAAFRFIGSGGDGGFTEGNEVDIQPGYIGLDDNGRIVIARFASDLPDDQYIIEVAGYDDSDPNSPVVALRNINGEVFCPPGSENADRPTQQILMNVEVGPRVVAVVPQPITGTGSSRLQHRNQIYVYFNDDPLINPGTDSVTSTGSPSDPSVVRSEFYNLILTNDTVETGDDGMVRQPSSITYESALNRATLTFEDVMDLSEYAPGGAGTFRLRVGSSQALPMTLPPDATDRTADVGDTFLGSRDLGIAFGTAGDASVVVSGEIEPTVGNTVRWPGIDSPGVRDERRDAQITGRADTIDGINIYPYNFANLYGTDASGLNLENAITPAQKQRTREILDLYSQHLGVQFIETEDRGLQIVTGDLRALVETADTGPGLPYLEYRVNDQDPTQGVLILDAGETWYDGYGLSPDNRPSWFVETLRGIGSLLGIGNTFEQVPGVASGSNPNLYNPFLFPESDGTVPANFSIEPDFLSTSDIIPGQALHRPEIRDADLYEFTVTAAGRISIETFAQRLLATSLLDSDLKLWKLDSSTGQYELVARNADFYGEDSFIGIDVGPNASGGPAKYVIGITAAGNEDYNPNIAGSGGGGRSQGVYEMRVTFQRDQVETIEDTNGSRLDGDSDGRQGGDFNFWFRVAKTKDTAATDEARTLFVNSRDGIDVATSGTLGVPYETIAYALSQAQPGDIVRLLPTGGADGQIGTTEDNRAYEIGRGGSGNAVLTDGETFEVPKGVTVMIDAGAILKLRNAKISVGSEFINEDRSLAALQVLGAPLIVDQNGDLIDGAVQLTSYHEEERDDALLGIDTNPLPTTPAAGDWAGIEFRNDVDYAGGQGVWESEGIFLDYVSHADIRYGGGSESLTDPIVTPLQMLEARPTLIYNQIRNSRDAAMSADPDSFLETNFHAPQFQQASLDRFGTTFTSDYDRVGPLLRGNTFENNSINGLFVRVVTPAGGQREPMTVSGRFDDRDLTHVLSEVLVLQGRPGGPILLEQKPDVLNVTVVASSSSGTGTLPTGQVIDYRVTFVTEDGFESLASEPTRSVTVSASGVVVLDSLPVALAEFAGRKLYRLTPTGDYELVTQLDRGSPQYVDDGTTRGGLLPAIAMSQSPNVQGVLVSAAGSGMGTLPVGATVDYRMTYVTDEGLESEPSDATLSVTVNSTGVVLLDNLPAAPTVYSGRNLYRSDPFFGGYELIAQLDASTPQYVDDGTTLGGSLPLQPLGSQRLLPRVNPRLSIDPGVVLKLDSARIESTFGADFYAEGEDGNPIVFTSRLDDTYGAGGNFDTNNDGGDGAPAPGDWSGLVFRQDSSGSLDHVVISYGGGDSAVSGGFEFFNAVEILQADVRIANSTLVNNASGSLDIDYSTRDGAGFNGPATIFVRGAQPTIVSSTITDNGGAAISINPDSLNYLSLDDPGRGTGAIDLFVTDGDNQGPLIAANKLDENGINGLLVRNESLTTESVWDDTGIVHVVEGHVYAWNHHHRSTLRLKSDPNRSLVVKVQDGGSLHAARVRTDVEDSIGGTIQVLGQPGFPVVLTSIHDCEVGSGFTPDGLPQLDTLSSGACTVVDVGPVTVPYADVIVVMDESGTMANTQAFSAQMIQDLEAAFQAAGIGTSGQGGNRYGAVGFGMVGTELGRSIPVGPGGALFGTAAEYAAATSQFSIFGGFEDGYAGIDFTLNNYQTRADAAKFIILATDEDRDIADPNLTLGGTISNLQAQGFNLQGILNVNIVDGAGQPAVAIDANNVYTLDPAGGFISSPGGMVVSGFVTTIQDYVTIVDATGGVTGDINQIATSPAVAAAFSQILATSIVGQVAPSGSDAEAGDWYGIVIEPGANDRNATFVSEAERAVGTASGVNAIPTTAQQLGSLARDEVSSDENRRLGFNVRGTLSQDSDIDVYTFTANGLTEVYLDIDDTDFGLDTVVELVDVNGNILALSDSSSRESVTPSELVNNLGAERVLPLFKTGERTIENPNTLDAGMRVVLPGNSATVNEYYVRVRSSNRRPGDPLSRLTTPAFVGQGLSSGQYQLSIRLRETDEIAGSTVRLADIRYATNALDIPAAPLHSPLAGEHAEELTEAGLDVNDTGTAFNGTEGSAQFTNGSADPLGSISQSDRGVLRVSGVLGNQEFATNPQFAELSEMDIDVFRVDLFANRQEPDIIGENRFISTVFDIDYSDQYGRANTSLAVYDAAGRLILHGRDSNIADDQGRPGQGNDPTNLEAGSAGTLDAYIGPVEMQEGTYFVVVSSAQMIPESLNQLWQNNPADTNVRILPIDSVRTIASEGFDDIAIGVNTVTDFGETQILNHNADLPTITPFFDETSIVPYKLEDVRLFVSLNQGLTGTNRTTLISVDPFTGALERTIGQFGPFTGDLAMRRDGQLFAYSLGPPTGMETNGNVGNLLNVSSVNASASNAGDDGLTFRRNNDAGTGTEADPNAQMDFHAMAFVPQSGEQGASPGNNPNVNFNNERMLAVGSRDTLGRGEIVEGLRRNVLYSMVASSGAATNRGSTNAMFDRMFPNAPYSESFGPASNKVELGVVDTGQFPDSPTTPEGDLVDGGTITGIAIDPTSSQRVYAVTDGGYVYSFNPFSTRIVDADLEDTGARYSSVIVTENHGLVPAHPDDFTSVANGRVEFASLTLGPRLTERAAGDSLGPYAQTLFGVTDQGWIYTMVIDETTGRVEPAPVLVNGEFAVPISDGFGNPTFVNPVGAAFSIREENPWHQTGDRNSPFGVDGPNSNNNLHGIFDPHNDARQRISGGASLYFGFEIDGNADNNTVEGGGRGILNPGGVHGSTVSKPFSLEGYSASDKPTLYFSYFLETEPNADYDPPSNNGINDQQVDGFRVFAAGDDGQWRLVSTNDTWRSFSNVPSSDEYDYFAINGGIPVQETFENTDVWRQARVDLSPLAGNKNVQLRFDFSTGGGMHSQFLTTGYLTEVQAAAGTDIIDGTTFSLFDNRGFSFESRTFQFVRGAEINLPYGSTLFDGQQISFTDSAGAVTTITLTTDTPLTPNEVQFTRTDTPDLIASNIVVALNSLAPNLFAEAEGGRIVLSEAESFSLSPERFGAAVLQMQDASAELEGRSLQFIDVTGQATTVTLTQTQDLEFGNGTELVTVTSDVVGAADGVRIIFIDEFADPLFTDVPARAFYDAFAGVIEVRFNSNPDPMVASATNNDYNAIVAALDGLTNFSAVLTQGVGTVPFRDRLSFEPLMSPVVFPTTDVYFTLADTADVIAQSIATKLNSFDDTLAASTDGDLLILNGATSVPITIPSDVLSLDGQSLMFVNSFGFSFELTLTTSLTPAFDEIQFFASDTPEQVASRIATALAFFDSSLGANAVGDQVLVPGASGFSLGSAFTAMTINAVSFNAGSSSAQYLDNGNIPIFYRQSMSSIEVRDAIREAFVNGLGASNTGATVSNATPANFPGYATNRIRLYNWVPFSNNSVIGFSEFLPGDEFGAAASASISNNQVNTRPAQNNNIEGLYLDDIVVGFAERGEVVLNAPSNRNFDVLPETRTFTYTDTQQPEYPNEILIGGYTLEVRTGAEYGVPEDYDPIRLEINEQFGFGRSFDTNDRLADGVTLIAPRGEDIIEGDTFILSNGSRRVTFEFDSDGITAPGRVAIPYTPDGLGDDFDPDSDQRDSLARAIRDAINTPQTFNVLGIYAGGGDSTDAGVMTGNRIDLFGDSIQVNPTSGRFLKVDLVAEETFYGRESTRSLPAVDHDNQIATDVFFHDTFARATVTDYVNGMTDTLVAVGKIGDHVATLDANVLVPDFPYNDADIVKIYLNAGDVIDVDLDTAGWAQGTQLEAPFKLSVNTTGAALDGQSVTVRNKSGRETTVKLTLAAPTSPNEVQYFLSDSPLFIAFRLANAFDNIDPTLDSTFDGSSDIVFRGASEIVRFGSGFDPSGWSLLEIFDENLQLVGDSTTSSGAADGETLAGSWINDFSASASGYYYVRVSTTADSFVGDSVDGFGEYQLTIRPGDAVARDVMMADYHFDHGDTNVFRDQGQIIIESNFISDFAGTGIRATYDPGATSVDDDTFFSSTPLDRRPGSAAQLRNENSDRLLPGTVIYNNVIIATGGTGIEFSGEVAASGDSPAPVPFGRIFNNTLVSSGGGTGIVVSDGASPTVLNNIISDFATGLTVAADSSSTVTGGNAYKDNGTDANIPLAPSSFVIPSNVQLFQDPGGRIFIPAELSQVIDSSFASLNDRSIFFDTVKEPVGISASPIIAPSFDAYGIPRLDDPAVTTPSGVGSNVFIDRGAIDRADFVRPEAVLVSPLDFVAGAGVTILGGDVDPSESFVRLTAATVEFFEIQLFDPSGSGLDARTLDVDSVILTENGVRLRAGVDYVYGYSDNSRLIRLTPLAGLWRTDAVYEITLNNKQRIAYEAPAGREIADGDQVIVTDDAGARTVFEFESGYTLLVPQTTLLTVTGTNSIFQDGATFSITAPGGNTLTFEVNLAGATAGGRVPVELSTATTIVDVRDAILATFDLPSPGDPSLTVKQFLDVEPVPVGRDSIQLGTLTGHVPPAPITGLNVSGQAGGVADGETFTYTTATLSVTFEFDNDGMLVDPASGNEPIPFLRTSTPDEIAQAIVDAVQRRALGLTSAVATDAGTAVLGGATGDVLDITASSLAAQGSPGVIPSLTMMIPPTATGGSLDGTTFDIDVGGNAITFRYTTNPTLSSPDRLILLDPADVADDIATKTATDIALAFPLSLAPTASGDTVTLGEPLGSVTVVNGGTAGLVIDGISGGAVAVNFLPTSPRTSIAATLQGAIDDSPLAVSTFSPGGGTILISNVQSLQSVTGGGPPVDIGVLTPAITDLAGNAVRETRVNTETRFTVIMPEVVFDLGDAPSSYRTLFAENGPRHTVGGVRLPRLGPFIDTELDGQPGNLDDQPLNVILSQNPLGLFTIDPLTIPNTVHVTLDTMPANGDTLTVEVELVSRTFEFVDLTSNPTGTNFGVIISTEDSLSTITTKLVNAIRAAIPQTDDGLLIEKDSPTSFGITSVDDEDGVAEGIFSDGTSNFNVFTLPGTDPNNIGENDVLGFLNPLDPAGTNIAINVAGAGLLHAWIDFDRNGIFGVDEQVLSNIPISGDPDTGTYNFVTVFTPDNAVDGNTWMRVRVSESGNLLPTGVVVGGEVEDYPVQIISIPLPDPDDDEYTINEDTTLDTLADGLPPVADGDFIPTEAFLPEQYIAGQLPTNGTLVSLDATTGHFVYQPNPDFSGVDSFTYRVSTQQNASASAISLDSFATVTINVLPINDQPGGQDVDFTAQEDLPLTIRAPQLLVGATPDADPLYTVPDGDPDDLLNEPFLNELNQLDSLAISAVEGSSGTPITAANSAFAAGNLLVTPSGLGIDLQVTNATDGDLVSLNFAGNSATFQLVAEGDIAQAGTVPIQIVAGDTPTTIAARLLTAIETEFSATVPPVVVGGVGDTVSVSFTPEDVTAASSSPTFTVSPGAAGALTVDVTGVPNPTVPPTASEPNPPVGDTLTVTVAAAPLTFELILPGAIAAPGNIPITLLPFQDPASGAARASVAAQLAAAINAEFISADLGVVASIADGPGAPTRIEVEPSAITAGKPFETSRGSAIALFDTFGDLIELRYISNQDLNRDNPPPAIPLHTDEFTFTVRDNGVSIDLVNNRFVYGTPLESLPATATIDVAPQNDPPLLVADLVSVGPLGPDADTVTTDWELFGGATPTEDQLLTIDPAFLLLNDSRGPLTAADENTLTSLNDTGLTVTEVSMVDPSQGTIELQSGMIVFTPAADIFGDVLFTYSATDQGINEDLFGQRPVAPLTSTDGLATISIQPVNDIPVVFDRILTYTESAEPGPGTPFVFTRDDLILGSVSESPNLPGSFDPALAAPFNESEQTLRVVTFSTTAGTVDVADLVGSGPETLTLLSDAGATFEFDFVDGVFTEGRLITADDYNERSPFDPIELFTYEISDDGLTTSPQDGSQFNLPEERSDNDPSASPGTVSITVLEANDAPTFDFDAPLVGGQATIDILERDDNIGTLIEDFAINILPGPDSALDETDRQSVVFTFPIDLNPASNVPPGLFTRLPELTPDGDLTVFPSPDAIGSATFVVQAEDLEPGTIGFVPRQTLATFVVNVQPVNDAPRFDPAVAGTSDSAGPDEAYSVANIDADNDGQIDDATITYTLREDNTQTMGVVEDYFIPLTAAATVGYSRIGLLDVFIVGPDNEAGPLPGGSQVIEFLDAGNDPIAPSLDRTTDRGGILTPVFDAGNELIGLNYRPPTDFNVAFAGVDSFDYQVRDDSTSGGETFDLAAGDLVPDRKPRTNRVELILNPVNDRPEFNTETLNISVQEDSAETNFVSYASGISAGPPMSAFDEVDSETGQLVEFTVTSLDFPRENADDFFSVYPSINEVTGTLNFQPAADVFGDYRFELVLTDRNRDGSVSDNTLRGDLISSIPVTLTISVQPINDPPAVDPGAAPLQFEILEDGTIDILVTGDNTSPGLLDPFVPGPNIGATDESADVTPGGNQTVALGTPIPTASAEGGSIALIMTDGTPRLRYTPRANFVGMDSFIYTVTDDGTTVGVDGTPFSDPRIASNTVTFEVLPVNDAPLFSGAGGVQSLEDAGVVTVADWATNVQAGPTTAVDEVDGNPPQSLQFVFTQRSSNPELFRTPPSATIDPSTGTAVLTYETNPDANGIATFEVVLEDNGPRDASIGDQFVSDPPRTFTIDVAPVNDPPTFDLASDVITRPEDSGPFNVIQAINISPGPEDEQSQTVTFEIEPLPPEFASLFVDPPTINSEGLLRFTPAPNQNTDNANGPAVIRVIARDSEGAVAAAAEFQIAITEVNDPPRAVSDSVDTNEDVVSTIDADFLLQNDVDPDLETNASESLRIVMPAQSFSVSGASVVYDEAAGTITYDPTNAIALQALAPGDRLVDSFAYSLVDAAGAESNLVTVALNVDGINDAPVLGLDTPQLDPDAPTIIRVLDNDTDVDGSIVPSSVRIELQPAFGSIAIQADGSIVYTSFASFTLEDVFSYTVADDLNLRSEEEFVTISSNASPIAADDAGGTFLDESIDINVSSNDRDPDGSLDLASIVIVTQPRRGQAIPKADGTVAYLPDPGFVGRDSFQYRISDNQGRGSNVATVETQVVASRLQNPDDFSDVNDDGFVTAIDALLIINRLARADGVTSIPVVPGDQGPNFYDVSGNQQISAADALRVINELSRNNNGGGISAEQVAPLPDASREASGSVIVDLESPDVLAGPPKIVDASAIDPVADDVIDLIAAEQDRSGRPDSSEGAVDAAIADLLANGVN